MTSMKCSGSDYDLPSENPYGYGLEIRLNAEQVEALGLDKMPPAAGSSIGLQCIALVVAVTSETNPTEEVAEGESPADVDVRLCLQITDIDVAPTAGPRISLLYG